jgi:predicted ester cyclase
LIVEDQIAEGDRVVSRLTIRGTQTGPLALPNVPTMPPSGRRFEMTEIRIDRIVDGRIAESWFVYDRLGWFEQLGILPSFEAA